MLPRVLRVSRKVEVDTVIKKGKFYQGVLLGLRLFKASGVKSPKIAIVVSKKIISKAVLRNTAKRRVREIMRSVIPTQNDQGWWALVFIRRDISGVSNQEVQRDLEFLLKKALLAK